MGICFSLFEFLLVNFVFKGADECDAKSKTVTVKKVWTREEKRAVAAHLGMCLRTRSLPGKAAIIELFKREPTVFQERSWRNVKDFIRNQIRKDDPMSFLK